MNFRYMHPAEQLVMILGRIYTKRMTTTSGGNLSIKDEEGNLWVTPSGIDKGTLTVADIVQIKPDGTVIGKHRPTSELPFHQSVYAVRPDVKAVLHAHPQALVSFSLVKKTPDTRIVPEPHLVCGEVGFAEYDLPGSLALGQKIAKQFAKGLNAVMMENHGVVTCGKDLFEAFKIFETLERCAALNILATELGPSHVLTEAQINVHREDSVHSLKEFEPKIVTAKEKQYRKDLCALIHRAYDQDLFSSTQGTFALRLSERGFLITPYGVDRKYMEPEDLVRIEGDCRECGKHPSRAAHVARLIFEQHPDVNAIVIAHPTNFMAFGITRTELDPRTIPESYIMIRNLVRIPYGQSIENPQSISDLISPSTPVILAENDFVLTVGNTLIQAFDRLEVSEFTANTILHARRIGAIVKITPQEVEDLDIAFHLK